MLKSSSFKADSSCPLRNFSRCRVAHSSAVTASPSAPALRSPLQPQTGPEELKEGKVPARWLEVGSRGFRRQHHLALMLRGWDGSQADAGLTLFLLSGWWQVWGTLPGVSSLREAAGCLCTFALRKDLAAPHPSAEGAEGGPGTGRMDGRSWQQGVPTLAGVSRSTSESVPLQSTPFPSERSLVTCTPRGGPAMAPAFRGHADARLAPSTLQLEHLMSPQQPEGPPGGMGTQSGGSFFPEPLISGMRLKSPEPHPGNSILPLPVTPGRAQLSLPPYVPNPAQSPKSLSRGFPAERKVVPGRSPCASGL